MHFIVLCICVIWVNKCYQHMNICIYVHLSSLMLMYLYMPNIFKLRRGVAICLHPNMTLEDFEDSKWLDVGESYWEIVSRQQQAVNQGG